MRSKAFIQLLTSKFKVPLRKGGNRGMFPRASVQTEMFVQKSNINLNTPLSLPLLGETLILALCLLLTVLIPATSIAQQTAPIGDPFENYLRILQADTTVDQSNRSSLFIRPSSIPNTQYSIPNTHPWSDHPFFTRTDNSTLPVLFHTTSLLRALRTATTPSFPADKMMVHSGRDADTTLTTHWVAK